MDSKKIIAKLVKIASNQQKIIEKLAQAAVDANIDYLRSAVQVAAANSNLKMTNYQVYPMQEKTESNGVVIPTGYVVSISGAAPNNAVRQNFMNTLKKQVETQKPDQPELAQNLSISFQ